MASWCQVKVHGNCHVQFEKAYYSVPYPLAHKKLWLKATTILSNFMMTILWPLIPGFYKPGAYSTIDEHMPPVSLSKLQDTQWCLKQSESIGLSCHEVIRKLFMIRFWIISGRPGHYRALLKT